MSMRMRSAEQEDRIAKLEAMLLKFSEDENTSNFKGSHSVHKTEQSRSPDDLGMDVQIVDKEYFKYLGKPVELTLDLDTNVVAYGTVVKVHGSDGEFDINYMKVAIDEALDEDAYLPDPANDHRSIIDSVGSHVMWPKHLLSLRDEKTNKKKEKKTGSTIALSSVPKSLRVVYCYYRAALEGSGTTKIKLLFGHVCLLFLHLEDVEPFCQLLPISYTCIAVYIWSLFKKMRELKKTEKFRFVDPSNVGHIQSPKIDKKSSNQRMEQRSRFLAERLKGTLPNQIVLVPCNVGEHWILTVIDPYKEDIGILDLLYSGIHDDTWRQVVDVALKMFTASKNRKVRKTPKWSIIKFNNRNYCIQDIDDIQTEWADVLQDHMYP